MTQAAPPPEAPAAEVQAAEPAARGFRINEDWAATAVGIVLVLLVLAGVIAKGVIP